MNFAIPGGDDGIRPSHPRQGKKAGGVAGIIEIGCGNTAKSPIPLSEEVIRIEISKLRLLCCALRAVEAAERFDFVIILSIAVAVQLRRWFGAKLRGARYS